jgi:hypothetical protein
MSAVSVDTTTVSSDIATINIDKEEEDDAKSPNAATVPPAEMPRRAKTTKGPASETPRKVTTAEEHSRSTVDVLGNAWSRKRARRAPFKPVKLGLRSTIK